MYRCYTYQNEYNMYNCQLCNNPILDRNSKLYCSDICRRKFLINRYRRTLRQKIISNLGGMCVSCNISDWRFLSIDHIKAGGLAHRRNLKFSTLQFYLEVLKQGCPQDKYQVLCFNCNLIKLDEVGGLKPKSSRIMGKKRDHCLWCTRDVIEGSLCPTCHSNNKKNAKKQGQLLKQGIIDNYGSKCNCCNENRFYALTIDHINNDGKQDRKRFRNSPYTFYRWLKTNNYPKDRFQLLCMNCNFSKQLYGECPHKIRTGE